MKRILPVILAFICLAGAVFFAGNGKKSPSEKPQKADASTKDSAESAEEMRGVWVTFMTLDVENEADPETAFKGKIDAIVSEMKADNLNTMVVHVRPFCDALYPSRYYPWSHILTGAQGKNPGYDPLAYIIEKAHAEDIAVHAWLNPYRISTDSTPSELCDSHPYVRDTSLGVVVDGETYLNPASEDAINLIVDGAAEIAENYDVDGIQFDDYFYPPYLDSSEDGDFDQKDYEAYASQTDSPLSLDDFRRNNVSRMVKAVYEAVHQAKPDILFGISPQGNLDNNAALYADVETWCAEEGYIDYICPQLYYSIDNPSLGYEDGLNDWLKLKRHDQLKLYAGVPAYKAGTDADEGTWLDNSDILKTELEIAREKGADGFMLYSFDSLHSEEGKKEIENVMRYLSTSPTQ